MSEKNRTPLEVLRLKFPPAEYVLIGEVSDASGFARSRSLDYMLINLWNSRGLAVTGIEEKGWRNDWLKELKNPKKQENHFKYCDYFYLLTTAEGVAKLEEIPATWGWWHINDKGILKVMKQAPQLQPIPIDRSLLCAMLRRAASKEQYVHKDSIQDEIDLAVKQSRGYVNQQLESLQKEYNSYRGQVMEFEKTSGLNIADKWRYHEHSPGKVGAAVKYVLKNEGKSFKEDLIKLKSEAIQVAEKITGVLSEFEK